MEWGPLSTRELSQGSFRLISTRTRRLPFFSSFWCERKRREAKEVSQLERLPPLPLPPRARHRHRLRSEQPVSLFSSARQRQFARLFRSRSIPAALSRVLGSTGPGAAKLCSVSCCVSDASLSFLCAPPCSGECFSWFV